MDSDAAAADLGTVEGNVVSFRTDSARIGVNLVQILFHGHGEWMVHGNETILLLRPLQQRELGDPQELVLVFMQQSQVFGDLQTQCAQHIPYNFVLVCGEQKQVTRLSVHGCHQGVQLFLGHEFGKGRFVAAVLVDAQVCKALGTIGFCKLYQGVDLLSRHAALSLGVDAAHSAAVGQRTGEYAEAAVFYNIRYIFQFHAKTGVRLVGTETVHGFLPGHPRDGKLHVHTNGLLEDPGQQTLIDINDIINVHERQLHIDLGKFRLTVRTQILVTEAFGQLEVTVITGAHQKLLEQLGRLGQCIETTRMHTARYQIVSGSLGGALNQDGGLDLQESLVCQEFPNLGCHLAPQHQVALQVRTAQIQVTVFQT